MGRVPLHRPSNPFKLWAPSPPNFLTRPACSIYFSFSSHVNLHLLNDPFFLIRPILLKPSPLNPLLPKQLKILVFREKPYLPPLSPILNFKIDSIRIHFGSCLPYPPLLFSPRLNCLHVCSPFHWLQKNLNTRPTMSATKSSLVIRSHHLHPFHLILSFYHLFLPFFQIHQGQSARSKTNLIIFHHPLASTPSEMNMHLTAFPLSFTQHQISPPQRHLEIVISSLHILPPSLPSLSPVKLLQGIH